MYGRVLSHYDLVSGFVLLLIRSPVFPRSVWLQPPAVISIWLLPKVSALVSVADLYVASRCTGQSRIMGWVF